MQEDIINQHQKTKAYTDAHRPHFALNRNAAGLTQANKEITFTLLTDRMEGAYIYDLDGNKHIDLTMGFGSILLGHGEKRIEADIKDQMSKAWSVGPMTPLAGELAKQITEVTHTERVAFFNSGTEAVMVALRLAKAATKKTHIVYFKVGYHGTFDPLLSLKTDAKTGKAQEVVAGVTQSILNESFLLDYGTPESLDFIKAHKDSIAAVLVEPVQSRRPDFAPIEYLKALRVFTEENNIALIFDEIITGFRMSLGGCQELFNIKADMVTYGKVIGGGMPIGIVAGKAKYLDYTDGGTWQYGDDSMPGSKMTFVAGTFCQHPLAMRSALSILNILKAEKETLYTMLNQRTTDFCDRMNDYFKEKEYPLKIVQYGSLFRFITRGKSASIFHYFLKNGIYVWEGRNCFFSTKHDDGVVAELEEKMKQSCVELFD
jgi:iturin family lipopeptide synthetase A